LVRQRWILYPSLPKAGQIFVSLRKLLFTLPALINIHLLMLFYICIPITLVIFSWNIGLIVNILLKKRALYLSLTQFNFITSDKINTIIGVKLFKLFLVKSFWRKLNPTFNIKQAASLDNLIILKGEVINSEIIHITAFITICLVTIVLKLISLHTEMIYPLWVLNIITNLYPVFVQQYNKQRLTKAIRVFSHRKPITSPAS
jgi:hypothetical protein